MSESKKQIISDTCVEAIKTAIAEIKKSLSEITHDMDSANLCEIDYLIVTLKKLNLFLCNCAPELFSLSADLSAHINQDKVKTFGQSFR